MRMAMGGPPDMPIVMNTGTPDEPNVVMQEHASSASPSPGVPTPSYGPDGSVYPPRDNIDIHRVPTPYYMPRSEGPVPLGERDR